MQKKLRVLAVYTKTHVHVETKSAILYKITVCKPPCMGMASYMHTHTHTYTHTSTHTHTHVRTHTYPLYTHVQTIIIMPLCSALELVSYMHGSAVCIKACVCYIKPPHRYTYNIDSTTHAPPPPPRPTIYY